MRLPAHQPLLLFPFSATCRSDQSFLHKILQIPKELQTGVICISESTCKGNETKAYLSADFNYQFLSLVSMGPNRAGKSKLPANLARDAIANGECVITPDFISTCQLSTEIASVFPRDKVLTICDQYETLQGMGYNEVPKSKN